MIGHGPRTLMGTCFFLLVATGCLRSPLEPAAPGPDARDHKGHKDESRVEQVEWLQAQHLPLREMPLAAGLRHVGRGRDPQVNKAQELAHAPSKPTVPKAAANEALAEPPVEKIHAPAPQPTPAADEKHGTASVFAQGHRDTSPAEIPVVVKKESSRHTDAPPPPVERPKVADVPHSNPSVARPVTASTSEPMPDRDMAALPTLREQVESEEEAREVEERPTARPKLGPEARFQVQIMSTSDPEGAEDMRLQAELVFPGDVVEVVWDPPNYKVRVGGAATMEAAQELKRRALRLGFTNAWVVPRRTS